MPIEHINYTIAITAAPWYSLWYITPGTCANFFVFSMVTNSFLPIYGTSVVYIDSAHGSLKLRTHPEVTGWVIAAIKGYS